MRIGLFMSPQYQPDADLSTALDDLLEQVRAAREHGFSCILVGQHIVTAPLQMFQTMPLIARLAAESGDMLLGPGVLLLSMVNPVMAAEEGATIDWLTGGNYVLAAGLGYRPEEFTVMNTPMNQRVGRLREALEVVRRLWTEERVSHAGKYFTLENAGASVRPKRQPHPPIWLGGDVEAAVRRAAQLADAWVSSPTPTLPRIGELLDVFRAERQARGLPVDVTCPVIREVFVADDPAKAEAVSRGPLLYKYQAYASWGQDDAAAGNLADSFDSFATDRFIVGDAGFVRDEMQRYCDTLNTDMILARVQWPGLSQADALANIAAIGRVVAGMR